MDEGVGEALTTVIKQYSTLHRSDSSQRSDVNLALEKSTSHLRAFLNQNHVDINQIEYDGRTFLAHLIHLNSDNDDLRLILKWMPEVDINALGDLARPCRKSALWYALTCQQRDLTDTVRFLLSKGADPIQVGPDRQPLNELPMNKTKQYWMKVAMARDNAVIESNRKHGMGWLYEIGFALVGQRRIINMLCKGLKGAPMNPLKPLVVLFAGNSGSGKSQLARSVGCIRREAHPNDQDVLYIDCGNVNGKGELLGFSGSYVAADRGTAINNYIVGLGGIRRGVVVFDEFDKLDRTTLDSLLLPFSEGGAWTDKRLSGSGNTTKTVPCANVTFFLTTTKIVLEGEVEAQQKLMKKAAAVFGEEMAGRIDLVLAFGAYIPSDVDVFIDTQLRWVENHVRHIEPIVRSVQYDDTVEEFMLGMYAPVMGLRSIRKAGAMVRSAIKAAYIDGVVNASSSDVLVKIEDGDVKVDVVAPPLISLSD